MRHPRLIGDISRLKRPPRRLLAELLHLESGEVLPDNFHSVDPLARIYRSSQPNRAEFLELDRYGFRSVLNLRSHHSDLKLIEGTNIREFRLRTHMLTRDDMVRALRIIRDAEKPLVIHCWHGSDRTGAVAAGYRIVFNGWSVEEALGEFTDRAYGHHRRLYRALPILLMGFDWEAVAAELRRDDV